MAFHSNADKTVYRPRRMAAEDVEAVSEDAPAEKPAPTPTPTRKTTPAKSASTKKES